ncbi:hypothetical protein DUI87_29440 [Hirundo rustica rustica]|uniref:Uncharacterized protein n=1 Tax=Hirundo rustica rustica TaxID=333673 RepID=A0A3M0IXR6_HIRRU|nr:hypothetical protein DUI87_29440 [Hirundo rustica rustica]
MLLGFGGSMLGFILLALQEKVDPGRLGFVMPRSMFQLALSASSKEQVTITGLCVSPPFGLLREHSCHPASHLLPDTALSPESSLLAGFGLDPSLHHAHVCPEEAVTEREEEMEVDVEKERDKEMEVDTELDTVENMEVDGEENGEEEMEVDVEDNKEEAMEVDIKIDPQEDMDMDGEEAGGGCGRVH